MKTLRPYLKVARKDNCQLKEAKITNWASGLTTGLFYRLGKQLFCLRGGMILQKIIFPICADIALNLL